MTQTLTHTAMQTARMCLRRYHYRYGLRLAKDRSFKALRMGGAVHEGLAAWSQGNARFVEIATTGYDIEPPWAEPHEWAVEREIVARLLQGYAWYYADDPLEYVEVEQRFEMPLVNPDTNAESRTFHLAGRRDGIVRWGAARLMVLERKTTGDDISPDSDYWRRLRIDPQISLYALSARHDGHDVAGVLYDVLRKPTIAPRQVRELDENGLKVVVDDETGERMMKKDGTPRQSAGPGLTLLSRVETAAEFGERLAADIEQRPEHYFQRREIPLLEDHMAEFQAEVWQQSKLLIECRNRGLWFRTVSRTTCGFCDFRDLCLQSIAVDEDHVPAGFVRLDDAHPELREEDES